MHAILEEGTLGFLSAVNASKKIPEAGSLGQARVSGPSPSWASTDTHGKEGQMIGEPHDVVLIQF